MNDKDWIEQLQSMMDAHEEPIPDGLWSDIESRLPEKQTPSRLLPAWRRYAAVAAVVLAVMGAGVLLWYAGENKSINEPVIASSQPEASSPVPIAQNNVTAADIDKTTPIARASKANPVKTVTRKAQSPDIIAQALPATEKVAIPENSDSEPVHQAKEQEQQQQPGHELNHGHISVTTPTNASGQTIIKPARQQSPMTVGLFASNNFHPEEGSNRTYMYASSNANRFYQLMYGASEFVPVEIYKAKHHAPISVGMSLQYPLNDRFSLTSGIVYTHLKSDFTSSRNRREQTLHYLGVPIGLTYSLWSYKRLTVYAIGGAQADFNVKATLKETVQTNDHNVGKDRVQFSALVGPGLHLNLSQGLGIYVEPSARYYFDNGSRVENYFKDKPWNINLNTGLRFTLP